MPEAAPKADVAQAIGSFFIDDTPPLRVVDRATLDDYADCPAKARLIEMKAVQNVNRMMASGQEVHDALSDAISEYIASRGAISASEIQDAALSALYRSRPDLQPDAVRAMKASLYHWARYVGGLSHQNILAFDGGHGERSGQLALDFPDLKLRITSEIDLLHAGPSIDLLHEVDYKTGHKVHTAAMVAESFQFQLHAVLVFEKYPAVKALETTVWNTRSNRRTWRVEFSRDDRQKLLARVRRAAEIYAEHCDCIPQSAPTMPTVEKCGLCPAAALCPETGDDRLLLEWDAGTFLDETVALQARVDARLALMGGMVKRTGREIVSARGNAFGAGKPKKERAPTLTLYEVKNEEPDQGDDDAG